ncbi:hypothetical protein C8Q80DRAFT_1123686 [Daedaleopsis nitida]|nr:hypothetical protein C8Q80DRAFT_1123686 [Daedaleopsis nitida]
MNRVERLQNIGYSPSLQQSMGNRMLGDSRGNLTEENIDASPELAEDAKERERYNALRSQSYTLSMSKVASGYLEEPFTLRISRKGCEFDGSIVPSQDTKTYYNEAGKKITARIELWYDNAQVSGYGDVREQVTKVDDRIRDAREIPANEFSVEAELLARISALWDRHFYPNHGIRVQPYKIHLYGPDGHFDTHRDTPERDLVGTFLLGLGDTTWGGGLYVNGEEMPAHEGRWCAFYPDVPHCVKTVSDGYRAVIAFKLFRASSTIIDESATSSEVRRQTTELVRQLHAPIGIMLERKYCLGTTELSGFDALLLDSMRSMVDVKVVHLPVVLTLSSHWGQQRHEEEYEMTCHTAVYPFTHDHIDVLADPSNWTGTTWNYSDPRDHTSCGCPWLEGVTNVPFFTYNFSRSVVTYKEEEEETCNYVGNEAQAWREDSVYLSYAVLALPSRGAAPLDAGQEDVANKSDEDQGSTEDLDDNN